MLLVRFGVKQSLLDSMPRNEETVTLASIHAALPSIGVNRDNVGTVPSIIVINVCAELALIDDANFKLDIRVLFFFFEVHCILLIATATLALACPIICFASHILAFLGMVHCDCGKKD